MLSSKYVGLEKLSAGKFRYCKMMIEVYLNSASNFRPAFFLFLASIRHECSQTENNNDCDNCDDDVE